jgi:hypothetical protein
MALTTGGRVFCWGGGAEGQLGLGQAVSAQVKPRQVGDIDFVAIAAGQEWKHQQRAASDKAGDEEKTDVERDAASTAFRGRLSQQPTITKIFAGAYYSVAISSSGHVYTWGSNDALQAGIPTPENLPLKDNLSNPPTKTSTTRELHCYTFDSKHNLLLPIRVDAAKTVFATDVAGGPNHMWLIGNDRTPEQKKMVIGRTLYEEQEQLRMRKLQRARNGLHSKVHDALGDGWTEGTTTQTDNDETTQEDGNWPSYQQEMMMSSSVISETAALSVADAPKSPAITTSSTSPLNQSAEAARPDTITPSTSSVIDEATASSPNPSRSRFSLPRMLRRLSLGKPRSSRRIDDQQSHVESEGNGLLQRRTSKRNSM